MQNLVILGSGNNLLGELTSIGRSRLDLAIKEYVPFKTKFLLTGGYGNFNMTNLPHAYYQQQYLLHAGIRENEFFGAVISSNTVEDAIGVNRFMLVNDLTSATIITSDFHIDRTKYIFEKIKEPSVKLKYMSSLSNVENNTELQRLIKHEEESLAKLKSQGGIIIVNKDIPVLELFDLPLPKP